MFTCLDTSCNLLRNGGMNSSKSSSKSEMPRVLRAWPFPNDHRQLWFLTCIYQRKCDAELRGNTRQTFTVELMRQVFHPKAPQLVDTHTQLPNSTSPIREEEENTSLQQSIILAESICDAGLLWQSLCKRGVPVTGVKSASWKENNQVQWSARSLPQSLDLSFQNFYVFALKQMSIFITHQIQVQIKHAFAMSSAAQRYTHKTTHCIQRTCCRASSNTNRRHTSSCNLNSCSSPSEASFVDPSPLILSRCATETARSCTYLLRIRMLVF